MERRCLFLVTDGHESAMRALADRITLTAPFEVRVASAEQLQSGAGLAAVEGLP